MAHMDDASNRVSDFTIELLTQTFCHRQHHGSTEVAAYGSILGFRVLRSGSAQEHHLNA